jgi:hypothetical protein
LFCRVFFTRTGIHFARKRYSERSAGVEDRAGAEAAKIDHRLPPSALHYRIISGQTWGQAIAMVLDRLISALTGKNIDKLSGSHELDSIEIR